MLIGVDIDEVLADLVEQLLRFHNERYHTTLKREDVFCYQLRHVWKCTEEEEYKRVIEFYHSHYFREIKLVRGSIQGVKKLKEKGNNLVIITSRHSKGRDGTAGWIERYFPRMFSDIYFTDYYEKEGNIARKASVCKEKGVELLIEDSLDNARDCASERTRVILLDCPWNRCDRVAMPEKVTRVYSWEEIVDDMLLSSSNI